MTDPTPSSPASPSPRRKRMLWGIGGMVVALLAAAFVLVGGRTGGGSKPGETHGHGHEGHDEHGDAHAAKAPKPQAPTEVLRHTDRAARAAATGNADKARAELAEALKLAPDHAPALFLQACLAVEAGNDAEAGAALEKLEDAAPGSKTVKLLERLRELRRTPGTGWQQAFREAWVSLGRPDLRKSQLLPGATPLPPDPADVEAEKAAWTRATSDDVKLLLALGSRRLDAEKALFLLSQVPRLEDPALYLAVMDALRGDALPESSHEEARKVFRQKLEALAAAHPRSMQLQLLLLLGDTEQGSELSAAELDALEKVAALPVWREGSFADLYQQARQRLKDSGVPDASATAMAAVSRSLVDRGSWILRTRNVGTRGALSPEGLKRLGRISRDIGTRMMEQPTFLERMAGLQLVRAGAQDMGDDLGRQMALAQIEALEGAIDQFRKTAMERWPLASLTEELLEKTTRDEPAYLLSFAAGAPAQAAGTQP
ncbi:lipopolysaccharide assembly protein LapB [Myxococcus sp. RHSTA-1-4]|uniref:tetratricopeptide repeat protein n=1 Tax=Myxococcus sp. RHSTA-1-4 TaxID=2874601 RepID=UPI001CBA8272|nr:hypothetical protein [Myxococcus sp. RHSTA-1-4]MBZ4417605.1 hypothetical protein [Myxococcus sp. RHSTA-1-4]